MPACCCPQAKVVGSRSGQRAGAAARLPFDGADPHLAATSACGPARATMACGSARATARGHALRTPASIRPGQHTCWRPTMAARNIVDLGIRLGLWRLDDAGLAPLEHRDRRTADRRPVRHRRDTVADGDHAIWVSSRAGLVRIQDDKAQVFDRRYGLPSNVVRGVSTWRSPDGTDVLWLATEAGVARTIIGRQPVADRIVDGPRMRPVSSACWWSRRRSGGERLWVGSNSEDWACTSTAAGATSARPAGARRCTVRT